MAHLRGPVEGASSRSQAIAYGLAAFLSVLAIVAAIGLSRWTEEEIFFPLLGAVVVASLQGGLGPGLLATLLSGLGFNVLVVNPMGSLTLNRHAMVLTVSFAATSLLIVWLSAAARRARTTAQTTLARFNAFFDSSPVGHAFYDPQFRYFRVNRSLAAVFGRTPEVFRGRTIREMVPSLADEIEPLVRRVARERSAVEGQRLASEVPVGSGRWRHWLTTFFPVLLRRGELIGVGATVVDVTDRAEEEERTRFLVEATAILHGSFNYQDAVTRVAKLTVPRLADWCIVDLFEEKDGTTTRQAIVHSNPERAEQGWAIYQRHRGDIYLSPFGQEILQRGVPVFLHNVDDAVLRKLALDEEHLESLRLFRAQSACFVPLSVRGRSVGNLLMIMAESGRQFCEKDFDFLSELGRRMGLAVDNARLYQQAQEAVQARDDFLSIASHDLRTPLTSINLLVQMMSHRAKRSALPYDPERLVADTDKLVRQVARVVSMLNVLLDVSRIQQGRLELKRTEMELVAMVQEVIQRFEPDFSTAGCTVSVQAPETVVGCWDRLHLEQVVSNLLANAAKYGRGEPVEISIETTEESAVLHVRDHGIGIAPDHLQRLFHRFERVGDRTAFAGTGLGLWIARKIVEAHGGSISVESEPGHGTTFTVALPIHAIEVPSESPAS